MEKTRQGAVTNPINLIEPKKKKDTTEPRGFLPLSFDANTEPNRSRCLTGHNQIIDQLLFNNKGVAGRRNQC